MQPQEWDEEMILSQEVSNPSQVKAGQASGLDGQGRWQTTTEQRLQLWWLPQASILPISSGRPGILRAILPQVFMNQLVLDYSPFEKSSPLSTQGTKAGPESLDGTRAQ